MAKHRYESEIYIITNSVQFDPLIDSNVKFCGNFLKKKNIPINYDDSYLFILPQNLIHENIVQYFSLYRYHRIQGQMHHRHRPTQITISVKTGLFYLNLDNLPL